MSKKRILFLSIAGALLMLLGVFALCVSLGDFAVTLSGETNVVLEYKQAYTDPGASATFSVFPFGRVFETGGIAAERELGEEDLGRYTLNYSARFLWRTASAARTVSVVDTTPPEITLFTDGGYTIPGDNYIEEGYRAWDEYDGDLTNQVSVSLVDGNMVYSVSDSSGNVARVVRNICYNDPIAPELSLLGEQHITMQAGGVYEEPGYVATDNVDGDITASVQITGDLNVYLAGQYVLTYTVTDSYGNSISKTRTVTVEGEPNPAVVKPSGKVIYLTFDDGPSAHTPRLLDTLARYNVKATFFVSGSGNADLLPRIYGEGHSIGIHTYTHRYSEVYASVEAYFSDLKRIDDLIFSKIGVRTTLLRFPGGSANTSSEAYCPGIMNTLRKAVTDMGYQYFDWNVTAGDSGGRVSPEVVLQRVTSGIAGKQIAVVLQHDIHDFSVDAVEQIIIWGLENGYAFLPLTPDSPPCRYN